MGIIVDFLTERRVRKELIMGVNDATADFLAAMRGEAGPITKQQALNIPAIAASVELISGLVSMLPIRLYDEKDGTIEENTTDVRLRLLNDDTGDLLNGCMLKKTITEDYLLEGNAYIFKEMQGNKAKALHYIAPEDITAVVGTDKVFHTAHFTVGGRRFEEFQILRMCNHTKDGVTGYGVLERNAEQLALMYHALRLEKALFKMGGNKRGFLKSEKRLSQEALQSLREGFRKMYSDNDAGVIVLNSDVDFKEASNTSTEMQLNESKHSNASAAAQLFGLTPNVLEGKCTPEEFQQVVLTAIMPILAALEATLNKELLLEKEKKTMFFQIDTGELLKGDMLSRYQAYKEAIDGKWISINEIRYRENLPRRPGLNVIPMNLGDVVYDVEHDEYYVPNTGTKWRPGTEPRGGEDE